MSQWQDIKDFHEKFALSYDGPPRDLPPDLASFRLGFIFEELDELIVAETKTEVLDALVDLVYVIMGTAYLQGFDFQEAWRRVHAANMAKTRGPSARSQEYDIIKPEGWTAPDLSDLAGE
jgi:predicted HAD superfamily Cof-like phosphohydrolase